VLEWAGLQVANRDWVDYFSGFMETQGVTLLFKPPSWPVLLTVAAVVMLLVELAALLVWIWRGRSASAAIALTLAVLAGPLAAAGAGLYLAMTAGAARPRTRTIAVAGLRGTGLATLAALVVIWTGGGVILAIAASTIAWAVRSYRRTTGPLSRRAKAALLCLRIAAVALLACWAMGPTLEYIHLIRVRGTVLLAVDTSASMARRDVATGRGPTRPGEGAEMMARITAVKHALQDHRAALEDLAGQADLEVLTFASAPRHVASLWLDSPAGTLELGDADEPVTAIGDALSEAFEIHSAGERDVTAMVLISDGCNNSAEKIAPDKLAALMGSRGVEIHTVGVGSAKVTPSTRILSVRELVSPDEVDAFNRLPVAATVEAMGMQGREVRVSCRFGKELVARESIRIDEEHVRQTVQFVHVPLATGFHRLSVTVEPLGKRPGGLTGRQDASKLVHVVDRGLRILYVEGRFRYESKYIYRALAEGRRFSVDRRILLRPLRANEAPPLSEELADWLGYHAIIFGDVAARHFSTKQLEIIRELVGKYGKGFCMIGGAESFGRSGWADTPIADMLGVDLRLSTGELAGPIKVAATSEGAKSSLMRIANEGEDLVAAWSKLPPISGANQLVGIKPAATVLAASPDGKPLIVAQRYGKGRSLAIAFDTTWRWVLTPKDTAELQKRFWRQAALFLAQPTGNVWIVTGKTSYDYRKLSGGAEVIEVTAGVEDPSGRPAPETPVTVTMTDPSGRTRPLSLGIKEHLRYITLGRLTEPGEYVLKISADVAGRTLTAEHRFDLLRRDPEAMEVLANPKLLRRMAAASGGRYVSLSKLGELLQQVSIASRPKPRPVAEHDELSDRFRWPVAAILIALLCVEWAVRKRKGLV